MMHICVINLVVLMLLLHAVSVLMLPLQALSILMLHLQACSNLMLHLHAFSIWVKGKCDATEAIKLHCDVDSPEEIVAFQMNLADYYVYWRLDWYEGCLIQNLARVCTKGVMWQATSYHYIISVLVLCRTRKIFNSTGWPVLPRIRCSLLTTLHAMGESQRSVLARPVMLGASRS